VDLSAREQAERLKRRHVMANRLVLAVVGVFSISLLVVGAGGAAVCDPHCAPSKSNTASQSNKGGAEKGLNRADNMANEHATKGLEIADTKPGKYNSDPVPVVPSGGGTGGSTSGGSTGGGGPCTGC
jgi:hypothetical protein